MSACFFSSADFRGLNLVCSSAAAFWPSLVSMIAFCTLMMAILVGTTAGAPAGFAAGAGLPAGGGAAVWAEAKTARLSTKTEKATFLFKQKTPKCEDTTILSENWGTARRQLTIALS